MNIKNTIYVDVYGNEFDLKSLDLKEKRLLSELQKFADKCEKTSGSPMQRWCDFDNYRLPRVLALCESRGMTRKQITRSIVFSIAQDMSSRLGIALGLVRQPNYRDSLQRIVADQFKTRREFCEATGLSEDMLSHVLAGRKDLSIETLTKALDRIGYTIKFVPRDPGKTKSA
jgi:transcriptional regulator with XRE-family HTH domain